MAHRLLVFDLDGTLVESLPDLHTAVNLALAECGHPERSLEEVRAAIGDGARLLIARSMPDGSSEADVDRVWGVFRGHYDAVCTDRSTLLNGALDFVRSRSNDVPRPALAVLTNKPQRPTDLVLRHFGLDALIDKAIGGDTPLGRKPDPTALRSLMTEFGAPPDTTLMIGDGPADLAVAQAAGVEAILLSTGYGRREELDGLPRLAEVSGFPELESLWIDLERRSA